MKILMGMVAMMGVVSFVAPAEVVAEENADLAGMRIMGDTFNDTLIGMRAWYYGLDKDDNGGIKGPESDEEIPKFIFKIVMNILYDLEIIIGLLATGFVIWGGYQIMMSNGDVGGMTKGKKTATRAIIGLVIAILAQAITAFITDNLTFS